MPLSSLKKWKDALHHSTDNAPLIAPGTNQSVPVEKAQHTSQDVRPRNLPLRVTSVEFLGTVKSTSTHVKRDLGFSGRIGNTVYLSYGDTLWTNDSYDDVFRGMTSDSLAVATFDPLAVEDVDLQSNGYPQQFCPLLDQYGESPATDAMGITSIVETYPGEGVLFFLKNHRPGGINHIVGAGIATVMVPRHTHHGQVSLPTARRLGEYWWDGDTEPWYGDVTALRKDDYIYAYGHAKDQPYVYVARVHYKDATKLSNYEYWNGSGWQTERLRNVGEKESIFWQIQQGQMIWSAYHQSFLFLYIDNFWNSQVQAVTSPSPTGPWSPATLIYQGVPLQEGGCIYSPAIHTQYDHSGRTIVVTFTNHPNVIQAIRVSFASSGEQREAGGL